MNKMKPCSRCGKETDMPFHTCSNEMKTPRAKALIEKLQRDPEVSGSNLLLEEYQKLEQELQQTNEALDRTTWSDAQFKNELLTTQISNLKADLQQVMEELAHEEKAHHITYMKLSQWQECARAFRERLEPGASTERLDGALALFTQLTTTTGEKEK